MGYLLFLFGLVVCLVDGLFYWFDLVKREIVIIKFVFVIV